MVRTKELCTPPTRGHVQLWRRRYPKSRRTAPYTFALRREKGNLVDRVISASRDMSPRVSTSMPPRRKHRTSPHRHGCTMAHDWLLGNGRDTQTKNTAEKKLAVAICLSSKLNQILPALCTPGSQLHPNATTRPAPPPPRLKNRATDYSVPELCLLEHGLQVAGLVELRQDVATADELSLDVQLIAEWLAIPWRSVRCSSAAGWRGMGLHTVRVDLALPLGVRGVCCDGGVRSVIRMSKGGRRRARVSAARFRSQFVATS